MASIEQSSRSVTNNTFGDNTTIYQNNIQNPAADQTDQCLKDLRPTDPRHDKERIQKPKDGFLKESSDWIFENDTFKQWRDNEHNTLLWIKGDPGKGKTMLLCAIIDELMPRTKLAKPMDGTTDPMDGTTETFLSYFFCQGTDSRINNATAVLRGLIYLIIIQEPSLVSYVQEKYKHAGKDLFLDANAWVALSEMLINILCDLKVADIVLIIDAIDECETDSAGLLEFITKYASLPRVKWVVSSRNTLSVQQKFETFLQSGILSLELKENAKTVSNAVDIYIEHRISLLHSILDDPGQIDELRDVLREKANGTFLWVSLVVKELEKVQSWEVMEVVKEMPTDLAAVYRRMFSQIQQQRQRTAQFCWKILSTIFTAYYPLSLRELGVLSGLPKDISEHLESIKKLVTMCGSFLTIRDDIIYFIHQSAKDFLSTERFLLDAAQRHADIYEQSIKAISTLPQNIYGVTDFGFKITDAPPPNPNPLASMEYSCFSWIEHFLDAYVANPQSETRLALEETTWTFLKDYVLRWLESVILLGGLADALRSIQQTRRELQVKPDFQYKGYLRMDNRLLNILRSTEKFIINNGPIIDRAPLQVYGSALVFSQTSSDRMVSSHIQTSSNIRQLQWKERLPFIKDIQGVIKADNALLQTLEGHEQKIKAICFSLNGKAIVSCCSGGRIRVWDAATGATQHMIKIRGHSILAISFSPDCKMVSFVLSFRYSPRDYQMSLGSALLNSDTPSTQCQDSDVQLDGTATYEQSEIVKWGHVEGAATFSLDGKTVAITEGAGPIELWNTATNTRLQVFQKIDIADILNLAFSPDSKTIASGHEDGQLKLWDVETGSCIQTFTTPCSPVHASAFQPDGEKLGLYGSSDKMWLLDILTGDDQSTRIGHDSIEICAIAFSPNSDTIASGFEDGSIRLWDANLGMQPWIYKDTIRPPIYEPIEKMILSPDAKILASLSRDKKKIELWNTAQGIRQDTFYVPTMATGAGAIAISRNGRTLALGCDGIWLWDIPRRHHIHYPTPPTIDEPTCTAIAFSPNEELLASSLGAFEIQLLDTASGEVLKRFKEMEIGAVNAIAFFPEGKTLAAVYLYGFILVWDATTGACLQKFSSRLPPTVESGRGFPDIVEYTSITCLPDGLWLCLNHRYLIDWVKQQPAVSPKHDLLLVDEDWITKGGKKLLWLPREYRTKLTAVQGNTVAIGHKSTVTFLQFNFEVSGKH